MAELAYEPLIHRPDLVNTLAGVAFTEDGKQLRFHPFGESSRTLGTVTMPGANDL